MNRHTVSKSAFSIGLSAMLASLPWIRFRPTPTNMPIANSLFILCLIILLLSTFGLASARQQRRLASTE